MMSKGKVLCKWILRLRGLNLIVSTSDREAAIQVRCHIIVFHQDEFCVKASSILRYVELIFIKKIISAVLKATKAKSSEM